jgi:hypothetical protein
LLLGVGVRPGAPYPRSFAEERTSWWRPFDGRGIYDPALRLDPLDEKPDQLRELLSGCVLEFSAIVTMT